MGISLYSDEADGTGGVVQEYCNIATWGRVHACMRRILPPPSQLRVRSILTLKPKSGAHPFVSLILLT